MLLLAVLLCGGVSTFADYVWQDGIKYALYDDLTAYVSDAKKYDIRTANIPEKITYMGNTPLRALGKMLSLIAADSSQWSFRTPLRE